MKYQIGDIVRYKQYRCEVTRIHTEGYYFVTSNEFREGAVTLFVSGDELIYDKESKVLQILKKYIANRAKGVCVPEQPYSKQPITTPVGGCYPIGSYNNSL